MRARAKTGRMILSVLGTLSIAGMMLAGVGSCAEMDSQDTAHARKAGSPTSDSGGGDSGTAYDAPNAGSEARGDAKGEGLIDLDPDSSRRAGYQMKPNENAPVPAAAESGTGAMSGTKGTQSLEVRIVSVAVPVTKASVIAASKASRAPSTQSTGDAALSFPGNARAAQAAPPVPQEYVKQTEQKAIVVAPKMACDPEQTPVSTLNDYYKMVAESEATNGTTPHEATSKPVTAEVVIRAPMPVGAQPPVQPTQIVHEIISTPFTPPSCTTQMSMHIGAASQGGNVTGGTRAAVVAAPVAQVPFPGPRVALIPTTTASIAFAVAIALTILATLGLARVLSKGVGPDGVVRFAPNTGSKISLGMGAMATTMLAASWLACREVNIVAATGAGASAAAYVRIACLAFGAVGVCVVMGVALVRGVALPSVRLLENMKRMGAGDLTVAPINSTARDELGELSRAADKLLAAVRDVVTEVSITSTEVAAAAGEIAVGAKGMSVAAGRVSDQCAHAAENAAGAGRLAENGGRSIEQTGNEIGRVDELVRDGTVSVATLSGRGRQIARVVELVSDLSDRTQLVAMNAAIEAAKAGPNGRAFAVLADEVRRLAERARKATEEAAATIRGIQDEAEAVADRMDKSAVQIKQSAEMNGRAGEDLRELARAASGVAGAIETMGSAAEEAGAGAAQSAGAAVQLSARAEDLKAVLGRFKMESSGVVLHAVKAA